MASDGNRVYLGNFDTNGLNVNDNWNDYRNDNLGLASARNFFLCRGFNPTAKHAANFL